MFIQPLVIRKCKSCGKVTHPYEFCSLTCAKRLYLEMTDLIPSYSYYQSKNQIKNC